MLTYKGTDKDMKCRGFQYKLGEKVTSGGAVRCGDIGFHSASCPLDVLSYYSPVKASRYFEAEANGTIDSADAKDSKIASSELILKSEIGLSGLIDAQIRYVYRLTQNCVATDDNVPAAAQGYRGHAAAQGDGGHAAAQVDLGHAAAQGDGGHAAAQGHWGHAAAQGYRGHAAAQGDRGHAAAQGDLGHAAAQGDGGHAAAQGYRGHAAAQGDGGHAEVHGENSIAAAFGVNSTALAGKVGAWLTIYEWEFTDEWNIKDGRCVRVDGEKIKPNVRYTLKNGEFVAVDGE